MDSWPLSLMAIFDGWGGYETSLIRAVEPLTREQLRFRPAPQLRSVGEIAGHIAFGRVDWFARMDAPGAADLAAHAAAIGASGGRPPASVVESAREIVHWLEASWRLVEGSLRAWTVDDLWKTYQQIYQGQVYAVSRQWTIWRIMAHDIQHGGQLTILLGMQGVALPELGDLGGHLTVPPVVEGRAETGSAGQA